MEMYSLYCNVCTDTTKYVKINETDYACQICKTTKKSITSHDQNIVYIVPSETNMNGYSQSIDFFPATNANCVICKKKQIFYKYIYLFCEINDTIHLDTTTPTCNKCHYTVCNSRTHTFCCETISAKL